MARKVRTDWFMLYRDTERQLAQLVAQGSNRTDALRQLLVAYNQQKSSEGKQGMREQSFARLLKAGRFLDSLVAELNLEEVHCGYVQVEALERIHRISAPRAQDLVRRTLANELSNAQLDQELEALKSKDPLAHSRISRDDMRQTVAAHERNAALAILSRGPQVFGVPDGVLEKLDETHPGVMPTFYVRNAEGIQAGIFIRAGGKSKTNLTAAFELYALALAHHPFCGNVYIVFPDRSEIARRLAYLAEQLDSSSNKGGWLYVAEVRDAALTVYGKDEYRHAASYSLGADEDPQPNFSVKVKNVLTGQTSMLAYFKPQPTTKA